MPPITETSVDELRHKIGRPDQPRLLDVCLDEDFALLPRLVPGARRVKHDDLAGIVEGARGCQTVVICQKGKKLSHGVAAVLRADGADALALAGGIEAWHAAGAPTIRAEVLPASRRWTLSDAPGRGELAAAWMIRRFADPGAVFLCVPAAHIGDVSDRFGAAAVATTEGSGLDSFMARLGLVVEPLNRIAALLGPDMPVAIGQIMNGLARLNPDPLTRIEAALPLFDALYAGGQIQ